MMTELRPEVEDFQALLTQLYQSAGKKITLEKMQGNAWNRFCELGLPTRKNDVFRYVKLRNLYNTTYEKAGLVEISPEVINSHVFPECQNSVLVFINGLFSPKYSRLSDTPEKMIVSSLSEAMRTYGALLTNQANKSIKEEQDPFAALNLALHVEGAFIYLPPKTTVPVPVQILHITDGNNGKFVVMPRLQLFVGAFSEIQLISTHINVSKGQFFINQLFDASLEEGSHVRYLQANSHLSPDVWHFDAVRAHLKKTSSFESVNISTGSATVRNDYRIQLAGENCETSLNGVWLLNDRREVHQHVLIDHQAPGCLSRQLFKGVLNDASHSSFEGKIMVRREAQETNAFQLNNNLLLSDAASAESKPNLEIFADNVKASHGATIGQLEKDELFYMQSRGFSLKDAQKMLVKGYCQEVLDHIRNESIRDRIAFLGLTP